jgi:nucleotide-binding universal stress UspA family protein
MFIPGDVSHSHIYERVLVPTDGSTGMGRVVAHAASLAEVHGATLDFVYVVNTAACATLPVETSSEGLGDTLRDEGGPHSTRPPRPPATCHTSGTCWRVGPRGR